MYDLAEYDYDLPSSLIAQVPSVKREMSRLLVLDRSGKPLEHKRFEEILEYFNPGDVLVLNDTRVVSARLRGFKETGGQVELLIMDPYKDPGLGFREGYQCLIKAAKRPQTGNRIFFEEEIQGEILGPVENGKTWLRFTNPEIPLLSILEKIGEVPLPPYIRREGDENSVDDKNLYQTVYATKSGAVAAPTAGFHFSERVLQDLERQGVQLVRVTLHVGYGTFAPIRVQDIRTHCMHPEYAEVTREAAEQIEQARREGRRIIAVGTTVVRILEWIAWEAAEISPFSGYCNHYIYPGYRFRVVDAMITNFHLPKSTLLLLVSAFAGRDAIFDAYREAIQQGYRFYSYGDAMLIL